MCQCRVPNFAWQPAHEPMAASTTVTVNMATRLGSPRHSSFRSIHHQSSRSPTVQGRSRDTLYPIGLVGEPRGRL